jgi:hypothetical protein
LGITRPSAAASSTRRRASVMRRGGGPTSRTPMRTASERSGSGTFRPIARADPLGDSVYQAIQSRNLRISGDSGGASMRPETGLKLAPDPSRRLHTTPTVSRETSGTCTTSPSFNVRPSGTA